MPKAVAAEAAFCRLRKRKPSPKPKRLATSRKRRRRRRRRRPKPKISPVNRRLVKYSTAHTCNRILRSTVFRAEVSDNSRAFDERFSIILHRENCFAFYTHFIFYFLYPSETSTPLRPKDLRATRYVAEESDLFLRLFDLLKLSPNRIYARNLRYLIENLRDRAKRAGGNWRHASDSVPSPLRHLDFEYSSLFRSMNTYNTPSRIVKNTNNT